MEELTGNNLKEVLLHSEILSPRQIKKAEEVQELEGSPLIKVVTDLEFITELDLLEVLSSYLKIPRIDLLNFPVKEEVISLIPSSLIFEYFILPVDIQKNNLILAITDPFNVNAFDEVKILSGLEVSLMLTTSKELDKKIRQIFAGINPSSFTSDKMVADVKKEHRLNHESQTISEVAFPNQNGTIIETVEALIKQAYKTWASDIHVEPGANTEVQIRIRIDGILHKVPYFSVFSREKMISRIKIMAGLDIGQKRLPQDGRAQVKIDNTEIDLRISILPSMFGEKAVIRLLYKENYIISLEKLGFTQNNFMRYKKILKKNSGMILVTGPTGCGKTTTLYSSLACINSYEKNIVTVEDPIECHIQGITQVQIAEKIGLTFSKGLRSILRQDPDIIMIGEIRDLETAKIAVRASLTGHLVFSTLHTTSAVGTLYRLMDMGIQPYLIPASIAGVVSQRLVRMNCPYCKVNYQLSDEEIEFLNAVFETHENINFSKGFGCNLCNYTGFKGRTSISELLLMEESFNELFLKSHAIGVLKEQMKDQGYDNLMMDALKKIKLGEVSVQEVMRCIDFY